MTLSGHPDFVALGLEIGPNASTNTFRFAAAVHTSECDARAGSGDADGQRADPVRPEHERDADDGISARRGSGRTRAHSTDCRENLQTFHRHESTQARRMQHSTCSQGTYREHGVNHLFPSKLFYGYSPCLYGIMARKISKFFCTIKNAQNSLLFSEVFMRDEEM